MQNGSGHIMIGQHSRGPDQCQWSMQGRKLFLIFKRKYVRLQDSLDSLIEGLGIGLNGTGPGV